MALIIPNEGKIELLKKMLIETFDSEQYSLRLYQNDYYPTDISTLTDFVEANFTNYTSLSISRTDWDDPEISSDVSIATAATQTWTCGVTGNTIYGYYVVGATSGKVLWTERFEDSRVLVADDVLNITPYFNLQSASV